MLEGKTKAQPIGELVKLDIRGAYQGMPTDISDCRCCHAAAASSEGMTVPMP